MNLNKMQKSFFKTTFFIFHQILDLKPHCRKQLPVGTRVCVYWSNATGNCLFPGTIDTLDGLWPETSGMVQVILDDGDERQVEMTKVRLLPPNYQHVGKFFPLILKQRYSIIIQFRTPSNKNTVFWYPCIFCNFQNMTPIPFLRYDGEEFLRTALIVVQVIII